MTTHELTDRDGDALTVTRDEGLTWITTTSGTDEVTVGPFDDESLREIFPFVGAPRASARAGGLLRLLRE
ncbi:hypothetical protein DEO23_14770 [Brachybacterium endophyticum]|uniref:Uncharacterized protein n=1 Tax=Brachybacterium endophyticum TaxID=2182385 RepID=A0A2U2RGT0_9MICO|nr:hypothetical protein [Brachybacterium endophyticum]PWH05060.1 hypothetical protein DEO23_14770 [Brachybacterium endophyticum]